MGWESWTLATLRLRHLLSNSSGAANYIDWLDLRIISIGASNAIGSLQMTVLVGGLEHFLFIHILGIVTTNWLIFFRGAETTNQSNKFAFRSESCTRGGFVEDSNLGMPRHTPSLETRGWHFVTPFSSWKTSQFITPMDFNLIFNSLQTFMVLQACHPD